MTEKKSPDIRFPRPLNIVLIGPPGAGKGTLAQSIIAVCGLEHISTGELFREEIAQKTDLGEELNCFMLKGELVPDSLTLQIIMKRIRSKENVKGFLLDGFPRTRGQAEELGKIVDNGSLKLHLIVYMKAQREVLIKRLMGRLVCEKCGRNYHMTNLKPKIDGKCDDCSGDVLTRDDDMPETIAKRFDVYQKQTREVIDYYRQRSLLGEVDAQGSPEKSYEGFLNLVKKWNF